MKVTPLSGEPLVELAFAIMDAEHAGQTRNDGVTPYTTHTRRVSSAFNPYDYEGRAGGALHDVIEDGNITKELLICRGIPLNVAHAVWLVSKNNGLPSKDYMRNIVQDRLATRIKMMDMLDNLNDSPSATQKQRYLKDLRFIACYMPCVIRTAEQQKKQPKQQEEDF